MSGWHYIVLGLCAVLAAWFAVMEWRRENRARRVLRVGAVLLAIVSLAGLQIPVMYNRNVSGSQHGSTGILLTEGFDADSVKAFMGGSPGAYTMFTPEMRISGVSKLDVFGYGLSRKQWQQEKGLPTIEWHRPAVRAGLLKVYWQRVLLPGRVLRIQGMVFRPRGENLRVELHGFGGLLDSTVIKAGEIAPFELKTIPSQTGRAVFTIVALSGRDTLDKELLPVEVGVLQQPRILVLAASPDFENRFLVDWLSKGGYTMAVRTTLSKDRSDNSWLNMKERSLDRIDAGLLENFDLVIADGAALEALPGGEAASLRAMMTKGLGLIVKADSSVPGWVQSLRGREPSMAGREPSGETLPLQRDTAGKIVASVSLYGKGRLAVVLPQNIYEKVLAGHQQDYSAWWSSILDAATRPGEAGASWHIQTERPRVNEPVDLRLETGSAGLPSGQIDNIAVYMDQDPVLSYTYKGNYWPSRPGWQLIETSRQQTSQSDSAWWYTWDRNAWRDLQHREFWLATRDWTSVAGVVNRQDSDAENLRGAGIERVAIGKAWFYVLFLLCMLVLWVERKI